MLHRLGLSPAFLMWAFFTSCFLLLSKVALLSVATLFESLHLIIMLLQAAILAMHRATPDEAFRRRSSLLTLLEHLLLCYRMLLTSPIWFRYFLSVPGSFINASMAGDCLLFCSLAATLLLQWLSPHRKPAFLMGSMLIGKARSNPCMAAVMRLPASATWQCTPLGRQGAAKSVRPLCSNLLHACRRPADKDARLLYLWNDCLCA